MKPALSWPRPQNWEAFWPALKGSLAKVYKPCIRPGCPRCASGEKHPAYIFSFSRKGRRRCMYVPQSLVALFEEALENGRRLEALLYDQGPQLLKEFRRQRNRLQMAEGRTTPAPNAKVEKTQGKISKLSKKTRAKS